MNEWKLPWEGGCRCGLVRLRVAAPPLMASACHCTGCQTMSAGAFSLTLTVPTDGFEVMSGEPAVGGLHGATRHFFCPHCMSWMFTRPEGMDAFVNLRPTMLDDHSWFAPFIEVFTRERLSWATTPAIRSYETAPAPDEFPALIEAYLREGARPR